MRKRVLVAGVTVAAVVAATGAAAASGFSFGVFRDQQLANLSSPLFGVGRPLAHSSARQLTQAEAAADPTKLATLAKGLKATVVTTQGPAVDDQSSLWPNDENPTYLITCNEEGAADPGLVRIELATGNVTTIVSGTTDCDPHGALLGGRSCSVKRPAVARTAVGFYELLDPLHTTGVTLNRTTGQYRRGVGASNLVTRTALGRASYEGIDILKDGTTYLDFDDSSLGPKNGGPGDFFVKFVPDNPRQWHQAPDRRPRSRRTRRVRSTGCGSA